MWTLKSQLLRISLDMSFRGIGMKFYETAISRKCKLIFVLWKIYEHKLRRWKVAVKSEAQGYCDFRNISEERALGRTDKNPHKVESSSASCQLRHKNETQQLKRWKDSFWFTVSEICICFILSLWWGGASWWEHIIGQSCLLHGGKRDIQGQRKIRMCGFSTFPPRTYCNESFSALPDSSQIATQRFLIIYESWTLA